MRGSVATIPHLPSRSRRRHRSSSGTWQRWAATCSNGRAAPISAAASRLSATNGHQAAAARRSDGLDRGPRRPRWERACVAVYPGDWAVALVAFDAEVDVLGPQATDDPCGGAASRAGQRRRRSRHGLAPDELILRIRVPVTPLGRGSTYHKISDRESYAFALASAAVALVSWRRHCAGSAGRARRRRDAAVAGAERPSRYCVGRPLTEETAHAAQARLPSRPPSPASTTASRSSSARARWPTPC